MKKIFYPLFLLLAVLLFITCSKFEVNPATKVETGTVTSLATSIIVNAKIIELSGEGNNDYGFCYATHSEPTINDSKVSKGNPNVGEFTSNIVGLELATQYYVRAYCNSADGIVYGEAKSITTLNGQSTLTTAAGTTITATTAVSGGNITSDGGAPIMARGVVWGTTQNPTTSTNQGITTNGTGTGAFTSNLTSLQAGTVYFVRAYATNIVGTSYGNEQTFTTLDGTITLTTTAATSITATTAVSGGNITSDGGATVTARGVVWSTTQNPTTITNQGITTNGTGIGTFSSNITGLSQTTIYFVRAYASNSFGTQYGNQISFTTSMPDGPGGTITDADGNTYNTIWINGSQWTKENLRTTKYNDGTAIPLVTDNAAWNALSTPAYCWYNNDQATYGSTYGALYNFYTVKTDKLCPTGWHVPTDAQWYALENYVDPTINDPSAMDWRGTNGGTKLKAISGWNLNGNGSDNYGFSALPGGSHFTNGFYNMNYIGIWWSSSESTATDIAYCRNLDYNKESVFRAGTSNKLGLSIRCVRDN